jgi:hypothetical protein
LSFITVFDDGGVVETRCPGTGKAPSLPNYRVTEARGVDASQLLGAHEQHVAAFARDRGVNARAATVAEVTATSDAAERPLLRQIGSGMHGIVLPFAPAALFVVGGFMTGLLWSPVVPLGICVAAAAYAFKRWMVIGPLRHALTRRSHVGDAFRERAPVGPAPAGLADVAADGTTAAMRKDERVLRAAAGASAVLSGMGPIVFAAHAPTAVAVGAGLIALQFLFICVTAMAGLAVLRQERGGPDATNQDSGSFLGVLPIAFIATLALINGSRSPQLFAVAGVALAATIVIKLLPKKRG